jgi:hypothetical protein
MGHLVHPPHSHTNTDNYKEHLKMAGINQKYVEQIF